MSKPAYLHDLRGGSRTIVIGNDGHTVRIVAIDGDEFDGDYDVEWVVAELSLARLQEALEQPTHKQKSRPGRRRPRWWKGNNR